MDDERSCDGSAFQTVGAATWKFRRPSCVLVEGTSMSQRSAERRFARPENAGMCVLDWKDRYDAERDLLTTVPHDL